MSRSKRILVLVIAVALAVCYAAGRNLSGRYAAHQAREVELQALRDKARELEQTLEKEQHRAQELGSNPLELEASIRRLNGNVRPGETVYRVELNPQAGTIAQP